MDRARMNFDRSILDFVVGLEAYFNIALPRLLLYRQERHQYANFLRNGMLKPSELYGGWHLLRLLVKLPGFMTDAGASRLERRDYLKQFKLYCDHIIR